MGEQRQVSSLVAVAAGIIGIIGSALVGATPGAAVAGDPIEFAFVAKTESQIQFGICTNIDDTGFSGAVDLELVVTDANGAVIKDTWDWAMIPGTIWHGLPSRCRNFDAAMQWVWPTWNSVSGLAPGTTYTFTATMTLTPVGGSPVVYTGSQEATTGGGCPVGAPDDALLRKSAWNGIGIDADGKAVLTGMQIDPEAVPDWVTAMFPQAVQWVPEYLWTGKTLAADGYYWDPVTQNFGPPLPVGEEETSSSLLALAGLDACDTSDYTTTVSVDPSASDVCSSTGEAVVGVEPGACPVTLTVTGGAALSQAGPTRSRVALAPPALRVPTLVIVRPSTGGGGSGSGGSGSSGSGAASGGGGGGDSVWRITEVRPAFGPVSGGTTILALGWGMADAQYATIGGVRVPVTVLNDGTVQIVTPPGTLGWQELRVFLPYGSVPARFEYVPDVVPAALPTAVEPPASAPVPTRRVVVRPTRSKAEAPIVRAAVGTSLTLSLRGVPTGARAVLQVQRPDETWRRIGTPAPGRASVFSLMVDQPGPRWVRYVARGAAPYYLRVTGTEATATG